MNGMRTVIGVSLSAALSMMTLPALAGPIAYGVNGDDDPNVLYKIDLADGTGTQIGAGLGSEYGDVEGLSFDPTKGLLYAIDEDSDVLLTINTTTGLGSTVGGLGEDVQDVGFAISFSGVGYLSNDEGTDSLFSVDLSTGLLTLIGEIQPAGTNLEIDGLAFIGDTLYGSDPETDSLYTLDINTGLATLVGAYGNSLSSESGLTSDGTWLYAVDDDGDYLRINPTTGAATRITRNGQELESLATNPIPEPNTILLFGSWLAGFFVWRWKKRS